MCYHIKNAVSKGGGKDAVFKRVFGIILFIIFFGLCLLGLSSCKKELEESKEGSIEFNVGYRSREVFVFTKDEEGHWDKIYGGLDLVFSLNELKKLCEERGSTAFEPGAEGFDFDRFKKLREYDDAYFEQKALVICGTFAANESVAPNVKWVTVNDSVLTIFIRHTKHPSAYTTEATSLLFYIEVNKTDVQGVNKIKIDDEDE